MILCSNDQSLSIETFLKTKDSILYGFTFVEKWNWETIVTICQSTVHVSPWRWEWNYLLITGYQFINIINSHDLFHKSCQLYCRRKQYLLIPWIDILWNNYDLIYCYQFDLRKKHFVTPVFFPWSEVQGTELYVAHCK